MADAEAAAASDEQFTCLYWVQADISAEDGRHLNMMMKFGYMYSENMQNADVSHCQVTLSWQSDENSDEETETQSINDTMLLALANSRWCAILRQETEPFFTSLSRVESSFPTDITCTDAMMNALPEVLALFSEQLDGLGLLNRELSLARHARIGIVDEIDERHRRGFLRALQSALSFVEQIEQREQTLSAYNAILQHLSEENDDEDGDDDSAGTLTAYIVPDDDDEDRSMSEEQMRRFFETLSNQVQRQVQQRLLIDQQNNESENAVEAAGVASFDFWSSDEEHSARRSRRLRHRCDHSAVQFEHASEVPIVFCSLCEQFVAPRDATARSASTWHVPMSLRRDERWNKLLSIYHRHARAQRSVHRLLTEHEHLIVSLVNWRDAYGSGAPNDYAGVQSSVYRNIAQGVKRHCNALRGFARTVDCALNDQRAQVLEDFQQLFPVDADQFVQRARSVIVAAQPSPMLFPSSADTTTVCSVCDSSADAVRLHKQRVVQGESRCSCLHFCYCLDCLLRWYWQSTERLHKSFATCPQCRAPFRLEDIVRVQWPATATQDAAAAATVPA